tara:strand:+ start:1449 stop:1850 length:402 start_codon:yes stop_codon:yes gene_type:complete
MPSKTKAQHNLMAMVANDPAAAKRVGIPQKVGKEFVEADKGRKFNQGGDMKESKAMMGKEVAFMKKKGAPKSMIKHEMAEAKGMKKGGAAKKMMGGGMMKGYSAGGYTRAADGVAKKGKTKGAQVRMMGGGKC